VSEAAPGALSRTDPTAGMRRFLLLLAGATFLGAALELWFADHTQEFLQLVPFGVCGMGAVAVALVILHPHRAAIWLLRATMLATICVSVLGVYEHLRSDYEFEREIRPNSSVAEVAERSLHGVAPALAPGSLALAAVLAFGATWPRRDLSEDAD
jgi:hypothetical protein